MAPNASKVKVFSTSTRVSAWDAALGEEEGDGEAGRDSGESSVETVVESDEDLEEDDRPDGIRGEPAVQQALSNGHKALSHSASRPRKPHEAGAIGSTGLSLCLSSRAAARADGDASAAAGDLQELASLARGKVHRPVEVESVLQGSPAHAAGIRKVRLRAPSASLTAPLYPLPYRRRLSI